MTEREKVIKGLECCIKRNPDDKMRCNECPYEGACLNRLKADALVLLKAQEPMVITPETMDAMSRRPVWLETKNGRVYNGYVLVYEVQYGMGISGVTDKRLGLADPSGRMHWLKMCDYGVTWRCWTSRPTDEQRRAEPWN